MFYIRLKEDDLLIIAEQALTADALPRAAEAWR
jgi:hypothetical protein